MIAARKTSAVAGLALGAAAILAGAAPGLAQREGTIKLSYSYMTTGFTPSQRFSRPSGLYYDTNRKELYVADTGNGQIVILDHRGVPEAKIPHTVVDPATGEKHPGEPRGLIVRKNGDMLVVDNQANYVDVLDFRGRSVQKIWPGDLVGKPRASVSARCIAQDPAGNVYIGTNGNDSEILVLGPNYKLKTQMGAEAAGGSKYLTGLWADKDGRVYATYAQGVCVRVFAPDGQPLVGFGEHDSGPDNFSLPAGVVTDGQGRIWVVDTLRHVVSVFTLSPSSSGSGLSSTFYTLAIGGLGDSAGSLSYPSAIAGDGVNRIFVVESTGARVQAFEIVPSEGAAPKS